MRSVLDALFSCGPNFTQDQEFNRQYAAALDDILRAEQAVKSKLSDEHWVLVNDYLKRIRDLHALDCRLQFERGFLIEAQLSAEVSLKCCGLSSRLPYAEQHG